MIQFLKNRYFIASAAVIIVIIGLASILGGSKKPAVDFVLAKRENIVQEVNVTGRVKPAETINLAFEKTGKISVIYVNVGDKVKAGQILSALQNSDVIAQLSQYKAALNVQKAELANLEAGTRPEEIQVQEAKVESAKIALEDAKKNLVDKMQDAYTKSDDAIRNKADQLFTNPRSSSPQINIFVSSQQKTDIEWQRTIVENILISWKASLDGLTIENNLPLYVDSAENNLNQIKSLLDMVALSVTDPNAVVSFSKTTVDAWKTDISTARTNINTAVVNLSAADEKFRGAQADVTLAEKELLLDQAGTPAEQINGQKAKISEAEANIQNAEAQLAKTILFSPIDGIITKQDAKAGEIVSANAPLISIISEAKFQIEANVPEVDIAKITIGDSAKITLDAYGNDVVFEAKVIAIDPAETILEGVATYKITLQITEKEEIMKPGMTANIDILTDERENVITIPQRAVITKDGEKTVQILENGIQKEIKVKTGLRGSAGNIEIIEGLKENDEVITFSE
ncbi:MAG: efflux RND transporter periplasmic adaptor subunit [Candidatus Parcubacteria bacterium]|nr:efflux RND transporter periplasmic adaptor subunit [Candidatus Parcubacteria bacterium]